MEDRKLRIPYPMIVEGKYDRLRLLSVCEGQIYTTDGFGIFKKNEQLALFRELGRRTPIIVLTDSDGAGKLIRSHLTSAIPKDRLIQLYIPKIRGKEKRKAESSAEGTLGVEGMDRNTLVKLFEPFVANDAEDSENMYKCKEKITKTHFYLDKLSGADNSSARRDRLATEFGLPCGMTANALLEALNIIAGLDEYKEAVGRIGD